MENVEVRELLEAYFLDNSLVILTQQEVEDLNKHYIGTVQDASKSGYYAECVCNAIGRPVTEEEIINLENFACYSHCLKKFYINGKKPCVPVFYRGANISL